LFREKKRRGNDYQQNSQRCTLRGEGQKKKDAVLEISSEEGRKYSWQKALRKFHDVEGHGQRPRGVVGCGRGGRSFFILKRHAGKKSHRGQQTRFPPLRDEKAYRLRGKREPVGGTEKAPI